MGKLANRELLLPAQVANLRTALRNRERSIVDGMFQQPDYPPLPHCPTCDVAPERINGEQTLHGTMLIDFLPCGHLFYFYLDMLL
ncbi:hypothetical protein SAMN05421870_107200 [Streptomyces qinglanensis]|uniref:Transposase n=2 Tax=Streptomyces qinglanensis TaxID=943816 RepID=A0A1H9U0U2_9ACTN|nr:hypothetical protein SAMN05421870_107200 [Streptomyces qinglanensis]